MLSRLRERPPGRALRWALAAAVLLLGTALAPRAGAQPTAEEKETARNLMDIGDAKLEAGDLAAALEAYRGADDIMHVPTTGLAVGKVQEKLGLLAEARETLLGVARQAPTAGESHLLAEARAEASALAEAIAPRIPTLTITVEGAAAGVAVELAVDGRVVPPAAAALPQKLSPGKHAVRASAEGHRTAEAAVELAEREQKALKLTLVPGGGDEPVDDEASGSVHWLTWVGVGVGATGIVVGAIAGPLALKRAADLRKDDCVDDLCGSDDRPKVEAVRGLANLSTGAFTVAGVGVVLTLVGALALSGGDEPAGEPTEAWVRPLLGPTSLGLEGAF